MKQSDESVDLSIADPPSAKRVSKGLVSTQIRDFEQVFRHRKWVFWTALLCSLLFYGFFYWFVFISDRYLELVKISSYAIFLGSLLGLIPTAIVLTLIASTFRRNRKMDEEKQSAESAYRFACEQVVDKLPSALDRI